MINKGRKIRNRHVLVDLDVTITSVRDYDPQNPEMNENICVFYSKGALRDILVTKNKISPRKALDLIESTRRSSYQSMFEVAISLGISPEYLEEKLLSWLRQNISVYPDSVQFLDSLAARGYFLYLATGNQEREATAKLRSVGLADKDTVKHFQRIFGSDTFNYDKELSVFYREIAEYLKVPAEHLTVVGDWPPGDLYSPQAADIKDIVLVTGHRPGPKLSTKGAICVKNLVEALGYFELPKTSR